MNIELIKKYKEEFDYHINGGMVYHCYDNNFLWCLSGHGIWTLKPTVGIITHIIKNDEYVEFRKALAEGKTIQFRNVSNPFFKEWEDLGNLSFNPNFEYRIKPIEPQFKDGDWLINTPSDLIFKYDSSIHLKPDTCCIKWKPELNEYCWDLINGRLVKVKEIIKDNSTIGVKGYKSKCITYLQINNLEPYIEELPNFAEDFE